MGLSISFLQLGHQIPPGTQGSLSERSMMKLPLQRHSSVEVSKVSVKNESLRLLIQVQATRCSYRKMISTPINRQLLVPEILQRPLMGILRSLVKERWLSDTS